jgi:hypothetical protein
VKIIFKILLKYIINLIVLLLLFGCNIGNGEGKSNKGNKKNGSSNDKTAENDDREYQHGIDFIKTNGTYKLIWGSSGNPPTGADNNGNWTHDVYYSNIDPSNPVININTLISEIEAQEPPSSAINAQGNIFITLEDGWNTVNGICQRYGVYDSDLLPVNNYPQLIYDGGHSGHTASIGELFAVFWCDDWDDSVPGADGIGTGLDVYVDVYSSTGIRQSRSAVSNDSNRDWWPLIAGSTASACLVWQRWEEGNQFCSLYYSIYDPVNDSFIKDKIKLESHVKYYTYDIQYYPGVNRFMITGTYWDGGGFAYLLDNNGYVVGKLFGLPDFIREGQPAIKSFSGYDESVYPKSSKGIMVLKITVSDIVMTHEVYDNYKWSNIGTDGIYLDDYYVWMVNLSSYGLQKRKIKVH